MKNIKTTTINSLYINFFFILIISVNSYSYPNNYQQIIPGGIAYALGGAGVCYSGQGEIAYYNSAGITNTKIDGLSLAVSTYGLYFMFENSRMNAGDNINTNMTHKSDIRVVPNTTTLSIILDKSQKKPKHFLTIGIFVPSLIDLDGETSNTDGINYIHHVKNWMYNYIYDFNITYAFKITENISWGFSFVFSYGKLFQSDAYYRYDINTPANSKILTESYNFKTLSFGGATGFLFSFPRFKFGINFKTKKVPVHGEGNYSSITNNEEPFIFKDKKINYQRPWEFYTGFGIEIIKDELLFVFDFKLYFPEEQHVAKTPLFSITYKRKTTCNINAGIEWKINPKWAIRCGFFTDRSASPDLDTSTNTDINNIRIMRYGLITGFGYTGENTSLIFSVGYNWGNGKHKIRKINDFNDYGITNINSREIIISVGTSYWFNGKKEQNQTEN